LNKLYEVFVCANSWELQLYVTKQGSKMHFANCPARAAVLFTTWIQTLRLCSSAEAEIVLNLFLNFEEKWASCFL